MKWIAIAAVLTAACGDNLAPDPETETEVQAWKERHAPRNRQQKIVGPWVDHYEAMARKTVLLRLAAALSVVTTLLIVGSLLFETIEFFGEDHVMFASDAPFDPEKGPMYIRETIKIIDNLEISEEDRAKIEAWLGGRVYNAYISTEGGLIGMECEHRTGLHVMENRVQLEVLRAETGLDGVETLRREGAPIPLRPLPRWDNGRDVILAGDAAGVVAPASGEGIFYAMTGGRMAADAVEAALATGRAKALRKARRRFLLAHGQVFLVLEMMQRFWYASDGRRERFVAICRDRDVQQLTWDAYMNKRLVRARPLALGLVARHRGYRHAAPTS